MRRPEGGRAARGGPNPGVRAHARAAAELVAPHARRAARTRTPELRRLGGHRGLPRGGRRVRRAPAAGVPRALSYRQAAWTSAVSVYWRICTMRSPSTVKTWAN